MRICWIICTLHNLHHESAFFFLIKILRSYPIYQITKCGKEIALEVPNFFSFVVRRITIKFQWSHEHRIWKTLITTPTKSIFTKITEISTFNKIPVVRWFWAISTWIISRSWARYVKRNMFLIVNNYQGWHLFLIL